MGRLFLFSVDGPNLPFEQFIKSEIYLAAEKKIVKPQKREKSS